MHAAGAVQRAHLRQKVAPRGRLHTFPVLFTSAPCSCSGSSRWQCLFWMARIMGVSPSCAQTGHWQELAGGWAANACWWLRVIGLDS